MSNKKTSDQQNLKKLMKIIYQKEKQIDKYKKLLKEKQSSKQVLVQPPQLGLSCEEKDYITKQIYENKKFLHMAATKLHQMENRILQLQTDLDEEENRNSILQEQMYVVKLQSEDKQKTINELRTVKQLLQNTKILKNGELSQKQMQIQSLIVQNQKIKIISEQIKLENTELKLNMRNLETEINKTLKYIHKNFRPNREYNKSHIDLNFAISRVTKKSQKQVKTHTFIQQKLQQTLGEKIKQALQGLKNWQQALIKRQQQWRRNFEKGLSQHSFDGISQLVSQSILIKDEDVQSLKQKEEKQCKSNFYESSLYKRNEEQLLKDLERECQKSLVGPVSIQKQKLVELSQVKQSLKMTKQVNQQLFHELNKQQNMIRMFKETFKSMEQKKMFKNQDNEEYRKLRSVLGVRN